MSDLKDFFKPEDFEELLNNSEHSSILEYAAELANVRLEALEKK